MITSKNVCCFSAEILLLLHSFELCLEFGDLLRSQAHVQLLEDVPVDENLTRLVELLILCVLEYFFSERCVERIRVT